MPLLFSPLFCATIGISAAILKGKMIPSYIINSSKYLALISLKLYICIYVCVYVCISTHTHMQIYIYNCVSVDTMNNIWFNVIRLFPCLVSCPATIILFQSCHNKSYELYIHVMDEFPSPCPCKSQSSKDIILLACITFDHSYLNTIYLKYWLVLEICV